MNATTPERELAETLIVLAGASAFGAAERFAREGLDAGNLLASALWARVASVIRGLTWRAVTRDVGCLPPARRAAGMRTMGHIPYDAAQLGVSRGADVEQIRLSAHAEAPLRLEPVLSAR